MSKKTRPHLGRRHRRGGLHPEAQDAFEGQRQAFIAKFGREPRAGDPVFFDPDEDKPTPIDPNKITAKMVIAMIRSGMPEELIYAYLRTGGMIFTAETAHLWPKKDLQLWDKAIEEYRAAYGDQDEGQSSV